MPRETFLSGKGALHFYGVSPPKAANSTEKNLEIAASQTKRINALGVDGVVLYDLQNEPGRIAAPRTFPFLPTLDPLEYARDHLAGIEASKIVYKCVAQDTEAGFVRWLTRLAASGGGEAAVLVGAPTSRSHADGLGLKSAYRLARMTRPAVCFGGVAIAERHLEKGDEDERLLSKHGEGCRFFISQTVYDVQATKSLLSDYALRFATAEQDAPPFIFSFAPCGSLKTMEFMKWLGIRFPKWLENELRYSDNTLQRSVDLCAEVGEELAVFARAKGLVVGMNVESVSIRKEEIEASGDLFQKLANGAFARKPT
jgi:hypothetical protein